MKLRGQRIELGEIEAVLLRHPFVLQAVVLLREDSPDNPQIVAYVVWKAEGAEKAEGGRQKAEAIQNSSTYSPLAPYPFTLSPKNCGNAPPIPLILHQHLSQHLPTHMLPSCFIELEALPLLPNGKVDRKALPAPNQLKRMDSRPPQTATEIRIANIWQEVLRLEAVGVDDNFFELGGNSLTATRVSTRVRKVFELDLPLRMMFEQPKIADLAVYIDAMQMALGQPISKTMATKTQRREIEL